MSDATQPPRVRDTVTRLWASSDIDSLFHEADRAVQPWPRLLGPALMRTPLRLPVPPRLERVDPRILWATQPWLVRHHAAYYGTGKWEQTGETSADMHKSYNRYPVITVEPDGRHVIRAGHHRSFAALVAGRDVWARVIRAVDKAQEQGPEVYDSSEAATPELVVTPHLRVHAPSSESIGLDERAARIAAGSVVAVETTDAAAHLLARLGLDPQQIDDRLSMALAGQIGTDR